MARRNSPRIVLNRLRWGPEGGLSDAVIGYVHRGAPGDVAEIRGSEILGMDSGFLLVRRDGLSEGEAQIPYHRILRIMRGGAALFEKAVVTPVRPGEAASGPRRRRRHRP